MKRILLYILFFTGSFYASHAQDAPGDAGKKGRIDALYVAYVTKQLDLTESEAQKFWPVHAQFDSEIKGVNLDLPELERQQKILDIKVRYQDRFTNILGKVRSNKFFGIDGEFRRKVIDEYRKRRQQNNNMGPRPGKRRNF